MDAFTICNQVKDKLGTSFLISGRGLVPYRRSPIGRSHWVSVSAKADTAGLEGGITSRVSDLGSRIGIVSLRGKPLTLGLNHSINSLANRIKRMHLRTSWSWGGISDPTIKSFKCANFSS